MCAHVAFKVSSESWLAPQIGLSIDGKKFTPNAGLTAHSQAIEYLVNATSLTNSTARTSAEEVIAYLKNMTKPESVISLNYPKAGDAPEAVYSVSVYSCTLGQLLKRAEACKSINTIMVKAEAESASLEAVLGDDITTVNAWPVYAEGKGKGNGRKSKTLTPASDL